MTPTKALLIFAIWILIGCAGNSNIESDAHVGNPVFPGWYADPEGIIFDDEYWIYPTYSDHYGERDSSEYITPEQLAMQKNTINEQYLMQTFFNAFSSKDLSSWNKPPTSRL